MTKYWSQLPAIPVSGLRRADGVVIRQRLGCKRANGANGHACSGQNAFLSEPVGAIGTLVGSRSGLLVRCPLRRPLPGRLASPVPANHVAPSRRLTPRRGTGLAAALRTPARADCRRTNPG